VIENVFANLALAETHGDLVRNIVSLRVSEDLFDDLSADPAAWQSAINLEIETKPPPFESRVPIIDRPFEEATWNEAIGYPFTNWMRSRFSDGSFGVWYGADTIETTVHETVHHWRAGLLADADGYLQAGVKIERKIYNVRCDAALVDLRSAIPGFPGLVDPVDYTLTQQVGTRLHREGHPGLVSRSARCNGDIYAVLNAKTLRDPRQACCLTYTLTEKGVEVERAPGIVMLVLE
jgi:hypothetical protein